jgi:hypothetical protein
VAPSPGENAESRPRGDGVQLADMPKSFKVGDHVSWNSEAGRVRGTIQKKITSEIVFKGYRRHASKEEPQYLIKSDKTDHVAIHKGAALRKLTRRRIAAGGRNPRK